MGAYQRPLTGLLAVALLTGGSTMTNVAGLEVQVRRTAAGPLLYVNGEPMAPTVLFVNLHDVSDAVHTPLQLGEVETAGRHGVNLVSLTIGIPWPQDGEAPDFAVHADQWIEMALKANPQALLIPRIPVTYPPDFWFQEHPDERMVYDDGTVGLPSIHSEIWRRDAARHLGVLVAHLEEKYGEHILAYHPSGQHTGEWFYDRMWEGRITSLEPPARSGFRRYLASRYDTDEALQRAWGDAAVALATADIPSLEERQHATRGVFRDPAAEHRVIDFDAFRNQDMADVVAMLCRAVKQAAPRKLSVAFYGYPFEVVAPTGLQASGHLGLYRLLQSPDVDVLCSPVSYLDRGIGGGGYFMAPVDSVHLHGKLWLVEDDTRTHLAPPDSGYGRLSDVRQTRGVLARNFGHIATRGTAVWWMDLPGQGWFAGEEMWQYLSILQRAYAGALAEPVPYHPEIAVIVDENSPLYGAPDSSVLFPLLYQFRTEWYRIGAPTGIYLLDDLVAGAVPPAKFTIILNAFRLSVAQIEALRRHTGRKGCVTLWMVAPGFSQGDQLSPAHIGEATGISVREIAPRSGSITAGDGKVFANEYAAPNPMFAVSDPDAEVLARYVAGGEVAVAAQRVGDGLSVYSGVLRVPSSLLRDLARRAGVHLYNEQDDVVMAGNGWLALHATTSGTHTLRLPSRSSWRDVISGENLGPAESLSFDLQQGDTKLLRLQGTPNLP